MEDFAERALNSACIIAPALSSPQVAWELSWLRDHNLHGKLIVLTRPPDAERSTAALKLTQAVFHIRRVLSRQRKPAWASFCTDMRRNGYDPPADPGRGAVVGF